MISQSVEKEYQGMLDAYEKAGGDKSALKSKDVAKLVIHKNRVLSDEGVKGLRIETRETKNGVDVHLLVEEGAKIPRPVHLCFGILPKEGLQEIIMRVNAKDNSQVSVIAHCIFPKAEKVRHLMDATVDIGEGNFLIEVYFRTEPGHTGGALVSKMAERGYELSLDGGGRLAGVVTKHDLLAPARTQLVLVDHNELLQAVPGADQVDVVEVVDHHRLGSFQTIAPIRFLNQPLGSTCSIIAVLYRQGGRTPDAREIERLAARLRELRLRYEAAPADAEKLAQVGMAPRPSSLPLPELAAWTLIANALLSLDATISRS